MGRCRTRPSETGRAKVLQRKDAVQGVCGQFAEAVVGAPVVVACGRVRIPDRRTLDRRLEEIAPQAETQIQALGLTLSLEAVTDATIAASDGSAFATHGPVWHKKDKEAGIIPEGLHGLDREADWIQSDYHGWVYGYKAHVSISVAPT